MANGKKIDVRKMHQIKMNDVRIVDISSLKKVTSGKKKRKKIIPTTAILKSIPHCGHDMNSSIADILDNSIDAKADLMHIYFMGDRSNRVIYISDNGIGMTEEQLHKSICLGYSSKVSDIKSKLGRFGLGLKTASSVLGKKLTVLTKTKRSNRIVACNYDPDRMMEEDTWDADFGDADKEEVLIWGKFLGDSDSGTIVVISNLIEVKKYSSVWSESLIDELGRRFRYLLPTNKKWEKEESSIRMFVGGDFSKNSSKNVLQEVFAKDPLERHLVDSGKVKLMKDFVFNVPFDGKNYPCRVIATVLDMFESKDMRKKVDYFYPPSSKFNGASFVRNKREIMAFEKKFNILKISGHDKWIFLRIEVNYGSELDDIFKIDFAKTEITTIDDEIIKHIDKCLVDVLSEYTALYKKRSADKLSILKNRALKDVSENITGKIKNGSLKITDCEFSESNFGNNEPIFVCDHKGSKVVIIWNSDHPFYQNFVVKNLVNDFEGEKINTQVFNMLQYVAFSLVVGIKELFEKDNLNYDEIEGIMMREFSNSLKALVLDDLKDKKN